MFLLTFLVVNMAPTRRELDNDLFTVCLLYTSSEYMASTGKRYRSHAATIRRWASEDARKAAPPTRNRDYSVKEDETV